MYYWHQINVSDAYSGWQRCWSLCGIWTASTFPKDCPLLHTQPGNQPGQYHREESIREKGIITHLLLRSFTLKGIDIMLSAAELVLYNKWSYKATIHSVTEEYKFTCFCIAPQWNSIPFGICLVSGNYPWKHFLPPLIHCWVLPAKACQYIFHLKINFSKIAYSFCRTDQKLVCNVNQTSNLFQRDFKKHHLYSQYGVHLAMLWSYFVA